MLREILPVGNWEKRTEYKTAWSQACRARGRQWSILARHVYPGAFLPGLKSHLWDLLVVTLINSSLEISFLFCIFGGRDCSFFTNHQENPSQMTTRCYLTSTRMVIIKTRKVTNTMRMWNPVHQQWACEMVQLLQNRIEVFPKRNFFKSVFDPAMPRLGIYSKKKL